MGRTAYEGMSKALPGARHLLVWGGVSLWRSLMRLDLIDEFHVSLYPYVTDVGTRLFDDVPQVLPARLGLQRSQEQRDPRAALPPAPLNGSARVGACHALKPDLAADPPLR
jgi:dihydrofolate reductase